MRALVVLLCSCTTLQARTAHIIGCPPDKTEISEASVSDANRWEAQCHDVATFYGPGTPKVDRRFTCEKDDRGEHCVELYPR